MLFGLRCSAIFLVILSDFFSEVRSQVLSAVRSALTVGVGLVLFFGQMSPAQAETSAATPAASTAAGPAASTAAVPEQSFDGTAEINSMVSSGNTKNQTTGVAFDLNYKPDPWLINLKSKYLTTVSQEIQTQESFEASARGGRTLSSQLEAFVDHAYLKNRFAGTESRYATSGGLGYGWLHADEQNLRTELSLGYTHEDRTDNTKLGFMSGVVGLIYKWKMTETADLSHETKYMPNFQTADAWRLTSETALSAAISSVLSSKVAWKYEHVNVPTAGKLKGDTTTTISILAKF